ncbi:MAG TPA: VOC family protein [Symbiobacteriaceae bacterium]|nr:VOC family protein [Symbiobacteriaceae bacterium]
MLLGLDHVVVFVGDLERAKGFYRDVLGLRLVVDLPGFAGLLAGGQLIGLHPSEAGGQDVGRGPIPYFLVVDIAAAVARLRERNVYIHAEPRRMPSGETIATIHDSEGNALGLVEKR